MKTKVASCLPCVPLRIGFPYGRKQRHDGTDTSNKLGKTSTRTEDLSLTGYELGTKGYMRHHALVL